MIRLSENASAKKIFSLKYDTNCRCESFFGIIGETKFGITDNVLIGHLLGAYVLTSMVSMLLTILSHFDACHLRISVGHWSRSPVLLRLSRGERCKLRARTVKMRRSQR